MERKINIGLFIDTYFPMVDGVIRVVDNYAALLSEYPNISVTVFAPRERGAKDGDFLYKIVRCPSLRIFFFDYVLPLPALGRKFKKALEDARLDIVHVHSPFPIGQTAAAYAKKHGIPLVSTFHSQYKKDFKMVVKTEWMSNLLVKYIMRAFNKSDLLLSMNPSTAATVREYGYKGKIELLPNGTHMKAEDASPALVSKVNEKYRDTPSQKLLLSVGRLYNLKNLDFIIDCCAELSRRGFDYKMLFVGDGQDEDKLKFQTRKLGLEEKVLFLGKLTSTAELAAYYKAADLFVFPSTYDTDGLVKNEAAAFYTPTLFSEGALTASSCTDGVNGYIAPLEIGAFSDKIEAIFRDAALYQSVCENAHRSLYFHWTDVVKKLMEIYQTALGRPSAEKERAAN